MKITLHLVRHFGGRHGTEMQVQARIARHIHDDAETERLTQTLVHILQEGARENFIRIYLKNDPYSREPNDTPPPHGKEPRYRRTQGEIAGRRKSGESVAKEV